MSRRELDKMDDVAGANRLPDATAALRGYQRSLGVPVSDDHPGRRDDDEHRRRRGKRQPR